MVAAFFFSVAVLMFAIAAYEARKPALRILWITLAFTNIVLIFIGLSYR